MSAGNRNSTNPKFNKQPGMTILVMCSHTHLCEFSCQFLGFWRLVLPQFYLIQVACTDRALDTIKMRPWTSVMGREKLTLTGSFIATSTSLSPSHQCLPLNRTHLQQYRPGWIAEYCICFGFTSACRGKKNRGNRPNTFWVMAHSVQIVIHHI